MTIYPLRFGQRYWLSSYHDPRDPSLQYTFCFDQNTCKSWYLKDGFKDNIYHTGAVSRLKPMDIYGNLYYFCKQGEELKGKALQMKEPDNAVVFIVKLKA